MAIQVGIREAKARLSALITRVRAGEIVVLTDRGRPVARVVPIQEGEATLGDRLSALESRGWVGKEPPNGRSLAATVLLPEPDLAQRYLAEDRDAR